MIGIQNYFLLSHFRDELYSAIDTHDEIYAEPGWPWWW